MLVASIIGPNVTLYKIYSCSMLVFACYIGRSRYWALRERLLPPGHGCSWNLDLGSHVALGAGAVLPLRLAHGVCVGVARALGAWSGAPSALAAQNGLYCMSYLNIGPGRY